MAKILIVGCGSLGMELGKVISAEGHQVTGLKRNPPADVNEHFNFFAGDITNNNSLQGLDTNFDQLVFIVAPDQRRKQLYRQVYQSGLNNLLNKFANTKQPQWLMVSSTSVYSQSQGEWVDEDSDAEPDNSCSRLIREAELTLTNLDAAHTVVRFSGIYGKGREYLLRMAKQSPEIQHQPPYFTNRIHQNDCVGVLHFILAKKLAGHPLAPYYLASDDDPAPMWDVMYWLTAQLACDPPVANPASAATASSNKRCRNRKLKELGYRFRYPSYKDGYGELIQAFRCGD